MRKLLAAAAGVELYTIPLYMSALYSIQGFQKHTVDNPDGSGSFEGYWPGMGPTKPVGISVDPNARNNSPENQPVVNDRFRDEDVVVAYSRRLGTASAWSRKVGGRTLTFEPASDTGNGRQLLARDTETGTTWSGIRGEAIAGPLAGQRLELVPHHPILSSRFPGFYPDGPVLGR